MLTTRTKTTTFNAACFALPPESESKHRFRPSTSACVGHAQFKMRPLIVIGNDRAAGLYRTST